MDAGQIVAQMNTVAAVGVAAQSTPTAISADSGEQQTGVFAGLMRGKTLLGPGKAAVQSDAATAAYVAADKSASQATQTQIDLNSDLLAALISGMMDAAKPEVPKLEETKSEAEESSPEKTADNLQADVLMSQNVAMSVVAGMQVTPAQQADGRTPETIIAESVISQSGIAAADDTNLKTSTESAKMVKDMAVNISSLAEGKSVDKPILARQNEVPAVFTAQSGAKEVAVTIDATNATNATDKKDTTVASVATPMDVSAKELLNDVRDKTNARSSSVKQETVVALNSDKSGQEAVKALEANASQVTAEKVQEPTRTSEFKFTRSASLEAALGTAQSATGQIQEKPQAVTENGTKISVSVQPSTENQNGSGQSDSGSEGKGFEGFGRQTVEMPSQVGQQLTTAHQFTVDGAASNQTQTLQSESSKVVSSEYVAGQVKEQLSSREIKQGNDQITIKLSPDHLGDIKVNFRLEDQRLKVEIVAENRTARESLMQHADSLKESLSRQNITMDKFDVTSGSGSSFSGQESNSQSEWRELAKNRQSQQWLASGGYRNATIENSPAMPAYFAKAEQSTLDLHY